MNGVRLHYVVADGRTGREDAGGVARAGAEASRGTDSGAAWAGRAGGRPPVVLLHGFPEFWYSWRRQMRALASEGWRVVAPDQRG